MDMYKVKWTALQSEIFRFLSIKAGESINIRGIAKALKKSPTAISNSIKELEKAGLITLEKSKTMNLILVKFNRDNSKAIEQKRIENLKLIYDSSFDEFLSQNCPGCTIILFGSYSKGEDITTSDIDIAVIGRKEKQIDLTKFEDLLEREIVLNFYKSWDKIHNNLRNNLLNGIILNGSVEL
jgi:predicted nucleotidyltransferase